MLSDETPTRRSLASSFAQSAHQRDAEERQCGEDGTYGQVLGFVAGAGSGHVRPPLASTGWQTAHKCRCTKADRMAARRKSDGATTIFALADFVSLDAHKQPDVQKKA